MNNSDLEGSLQMVGYIVQTTELACTVADVNKSDNDKAWAIANTVVSAMTGMSMRSENRQQVLRALPPEQQTLLLSGVTSTVERFFGREVAQRTQNFIVRISPVVIVAVQLSWEAIKNIRLWYKGEISGARCVKTIVDAAAGALGGLGGGAAGIAIGTAILPGIGTVFGASLGGLIGSIAAAELSKYLTEQIFDLPPSIALEKAYQFLGLTKSCTNEQINSAYRHLALRYHPDKGGSNDSWQRLQVSVQLIKESRGQCDG